MSDLLTILLALGVIALAVVTFRPSRAEMERRREEASFRAHVRRVGESQ